MTDLPVEEYEVGRAAYWDCNLSPLTSRSVLGLSQWCLEVCINLEYMESSNADMIQEGFAFFKLHVILQWLLPTV